MKKWFVITALSMLAAVAAADEICTTGPMWNYCVGSTIGPPRWGTLSGDWSACSGTNPNIPQSPIRIPSSQTFDPDLGPMEIHYGTIDDLNVTNTSHAIKMKPLPSGNYILVGPNKVRYDLVEFHFHVPAEHPFPSLPSAIAELHLVHHGPGGEALAIGILMVGSANNIDNPSLETIITAIPGTPLCGEKKAGALNLAALVPFPEPTYFIHYKGSLTTPACTAVSWYLLMTPITISEQQKGVLNIFGGNARPARDVSAGERVFYWRKTTK